MAGPCWSMSISGRQLCAELDDVVVATCDTAIVDAVRAFGGHAVMTADTHDRASDRVAEAAEKSRWRYFRAGAGR